MCSTLLCNKLDLKIVCYVYSLTFILLFIPAHILFQTHMTTEMLGRGMYI